MLSIVFHGSKIVGIPPFKKAEWDRLKHLTFIETDLLSCDAIAELQRPGLRILSECLTAKVKFEPCGHPAGCYCTTPVMNEIHCLHNVTVFPTFDEVIKQKVLSIVFQGSKIIEIPPFEKEWDTLKQLTFIDTDLMSCEDITKLQRTGLRILSECITPKVNCSKGIGICLVFTIILVLGFSGSVGYIIYLLQLRTWSPLVTSPDMFMTSEAKNTADTHTLEDINLCTKTHDVTGIVMITENNALQQAL